MIINETGGAKSGVFVFRRKPSENKYYCEICGKETDNLYPLNDMGLCLDCMPRTREED
jgi:hypothetical protein